MTPSTAPSSLAIESSTGGLLQLSNKNNTFFIDWDVHIKHWMILPRGLTVEEVAGIGEDVIKG